MRVLLLSDIHANLAALDACLADAERAGRADRVWVLGDTVGYGPRPVECLLRIRGLDALAVAGNHELAATDRLPLSQFNAHAAAAAQWTAGQLTPDAAGYVTSLPLRATEGEFTLVHGTPRDPVWEYMLSVSQGVASLPYLETPGCAFGHTHVPTVMQFRGAEGGIRQVTAGEAVQLREERWFVNPGSAGQPRDGDPRAAYALLETDERTVTYRRVEYDVAVTQRLMEEAGLPRPLIERLSYGY